MNESKRILQTTNRALFGGQIVTIGSSSSIAIVIAGAPCIGVVIVVVIAITTVVRVATVGTAGRFSTPHITG